MNPDETPPAPGELTAHPGDPVPLDARQKPPLVPPGTEPQRPESMEPEQLGYTPRRGVPWLSPLLLAGTAVRVVMAELFGAYLDKRELQSALPDPTFDERPDGDDDAEVWFDFVADAGDSFNATYSIAYLLAQPTLEVDGERLPRGRMLVLGGDQVYPTASGQQYEDRFKGPFRAALPQLAPDGPRMYALPGNHDWYDGLTAFLRLFARREGHIGGWRTAQSRSYFAIQLPHRWWLFAMDAQLGSYLDDPQLQYFQQVAEGLQEGDRVILCTPNPTWLIGASDPHAYDTTEYFLRTVIRPRGAQVRLMLSGDLHHYNRYTGPDRELVTCGGGGAYLYATHALPECIDVPPKATLMRRVSPSQRYDLAASFPTRQQSRWFAAGVFGRLPWRNPGFVSLLGTVHALLMLALAGAMTQRMSGTELRLFTIPVVIMAVITLGGAVAFALPPLAGHRRPKHWMLGLAHGSAHVGLGVLGAWVWERLPFQDLPWPQPLLVAALLYLPVAGLVASQVVAVYLLIASLFKVNINELFAGQGIVDAKSFVRLRIREDGTLTVYPVAVDRVARRWRAAPGSPGDRPWLEPAEPLPVRFAEPPITL